MKRKSNQIKTNRTCTFEILEERQHFSVYTVSNTNDSGGGSLPQAILDLNTDRSSGTDTITFAIGTRSQQHC